MPAPYPNGTLKSPLTQGQYDDITLWLANKFPTAGNVSQWRHLYPKGNTTSETALIQQYELGAFGTSGGKIPGKGAAPPKPLPGSPLPGGSLTGIPDAVKGTINSVTDFLNLLTSAALWLRILEVAVGLLLLGVGLAKLTGTANVATKLVSRGTLGK